MKSLAIVTAGLAMVSGFVAAWYWWKSTRVTPIWFNPDGEPESIAGAAAGNTASLFLAGQESSRLNKLAAIWTAVSVGLSGISGFAGALGL